MLRFLGRGSAFADEHNSAFFINQHELVLLDCPATSFQKIKKMKLWDKTEHIYILITHTHGDHSGGTGAMIQYAQFVLHIPVTVIAPSEAVAEDLYLLLTRIEGCEENWFTLITADKAEKNWLKKAIRTTHVTPLKDKCFGYLLCIRGKTVVYTGDTAVLFPYLEYLTEDTYLYTEAAALDSGVHLLLRDVLPILLDLTQKHVHVYLMHLDKEEEIASMIEGTSIQLAPLYQEEK